MKKQKKSRKKIWAGVAILVIVAVIGALLIGVTNRWFNGKKVELDAEYYHTDSGFMGLDSDEYELLVEGGKSFVVFVDQSGCTTADRLREYMRLYMEQNRITVYKMMFSNIKDMSLHDYVKYYPSVAIIGKGEVKAYLRADSNEDASIYNNYDDFERWMDEHLQK